MRGLRERIRAEWGASSVAALLIVALGCGTTAVSGARVLRAQIAPRQGLRALAAEVALVVSDECLDCGFVNYDTVYRAWSLESVVEVALPDYEPESFGPWPAYDDFYSEEAAADGSITQWSDGYYITHNWSEYGKQILELVPGDTVTVGDVTMKVEGVFDYPFDGMLGQIRSIVGEEAIVLQTCEPDTDELRRIVYGPRIDE